MNGSNRAFTLIELLLVMAIMGFMATISIGGYRAMRQGMEQTNVLRNVDQFIHNAYLRAQIDRQPTAVYFWNETLQEESADGATNLIVVGHAVAVRRSGRITAFANNHLYDEFGDWKYGGSDNLEGGHEEDEEGSSDSRNTMRLYRMNGTETSGPKYAEVNAIAELDENKSKIQSMMSDPVWSSNHSGDDDAARILQYGYKIEGGNQTSWKAGDAYGFEFSSMTLPHGYIFESTYSQKVSDPIKEINKTIWCAPGESSSTTIDIYAMRPNEQGALAPKKVDSTQAANKDPSRNKY